MLGLEFDFEVSELEKNLFMKKEFSPVAVAIKIL